jgi:hypothetical protein
MPGSPVGPVSPRGPSPITYAAITVEIAMVAIAVVTAMTQTAITNVLRRTSSGRSNPIWVRFLPLDAALVGASEAGILGSCWVASSFSAMRSP